MQVAHHIEAIRGEAMAFASAAGRAGLDTPVPTCPGWTTRDLVRHLGEIHLWAAAHVALPDDGPHYATEAELLAGLSERWPELGTFWVEDDELIEWYLATNANLVRTLEVAPPDVEAWTFLPAPTPLAMWARRQAHETAIHRFDAEVATGEVHGYEKTFASDGVDEILAGMTTQRRLDVPVSEPRSMLVHARDTGDRWLVPFESDTVSTVWGDGAADVVVTGDAADLYLALWNRTDDSVLDVEGDRRTLDTWHQHFRCRWYQAD